jgi:drug/metabolite transporter (DMT)-like permease
MVSSLGISGETPMSEPRMGAPEWLMLILLSIVWGGSFFFAEIALFAYGPLTIVAIRVAIGAVGLLLLARILGHVLPSKVGLWRDLFVMGALNNVIPFSLIVWGQTHVDSGTASILNGTTPFFTICLAHFLIAEERMTVAKVIGIGLGIAGVAVLAGPTAMHGLTQAVEGQIAVLLAAISYAFAGVWGRKRLSGIASMPAATGMLLASSVIMVPLALFWEGAPELPPSMEVWGALVGIGLLSTSLAYLLYFKILAVAGASNLLLVTMLVPVSAMLLGVFVLGEEIRLDAIAGMGLIAMGLAVINGRLLRIVGVGGV